MKKPRTMPKSAADLVPPLAGLALIVLFSSLGFWQLDRADQKRALQASFDTHGEYLPISAVATPSRYQPVVASGRFLGERQFLIDNMVLDGRLGYFVITPFEFKADGPLLLVNRGWIGKSPAVEGLPSIAVSNATQTVKGRAGHLPRAAIRPGSALGGAGGWPKVATFPTAEELGSALGRDVLPFVLLADPDPATNLVRRWQPQQIGPMRHIGYAFQWFALALTVIVVTVVLYRKKRADK